MPPALRHSLAAIRGWLLFIFDSPRTSQAFSQQEHKPSHSRSISAKQFVHASALSQLLAAIRGWLLFIFDSPRTSQAFSQQEHLSQAVCRPHATGA
jgi:hypothetical protein